jgi:hypothetical protein
VTQLEGHKSQPFPLSNPVHESFTGHDHFPSTKGVIVLTILLVILILMALGALPTWPHSRSWGYYPSSGLGLVVIILVVLLLLGRI